MLGRCGQRRALIVRAAARADCAGSCALMMQAAQLLIVQVVYPTIRKARENEAVHLGTPCSW